MTASSSIPPAGRKSPQGSPRSSNAAIVAKGAPAYGSSCRQTELANAHPQRPVGGIARRTLCSRTARSVRAKPAARDRRRRGYRSWILTICRPSRASVLRRCSPLIIEIAVALGERGRVSQSFRRKVSVGASLAIPWPPLYAASSPAALVGQRAWAAAGAAAGRLARSRDVAPSRWPARKAWRC